MNLRLALPLLLLSCRDTPKDDVPNDTGAEETGEVLDDTQIEDIDGDGDGFPASDDCDDADAEVNSGAVEVCDGIDNDCDGLVDDADDPVSGRANWYPDVDGDGYGNADVVQAGCEAPVGFVADDTDCDDLDPRFYPGADESDCTDENDYNCDGSVGYADVDGDGFAACEDCDDTVASTNPLAFEICDEADNDCDGASDEDDAVDAATWYADADGDGFGDENTVAQACEVPSGHVGDDADCDDTDPALHPDAAETCDSADNDCDGLVDDADPSLTGASTWFGDSDGDGFGGSQYQQVACQAPAGFVASSDDCDDLDASSHPGASEVCDGADNDCDAVVDEGVGNTWFEDSDGDGYGNGTVTTVSCEAPTGFVGNALDCDDFSATTSPASYEVCDGVDNDCDGSIDESAINAPTWYPDGDGDGYGVSSGTSNDCSQPSGFAASANDCDDSNAAISPAATEVCDGVDNDCDGDVDDADSDLDASSGVVLYVDSDGDGYGDGSSPAAACASGSGFAENDLDCDDSNAAILPEPGGGCGLGVDCLGILDAGLSTGDGVYIIDPDGHGTGEAALNAWCDMTSDGGGWTRASTIPLANPSCVFTTGVQNDPSTASGTCSKYADSVINAIARNKIFVARVPGYSPTFTTWADAIRVDGHPGLVTQADTLAGVEGVTPSYTPQYGGWDFFHQQNWYHTDRCLGTSASTSRLSLEYITNTGNLYACSGSCSSDCPSGGIRGVTAEVYVR